MHLRVLQGCLAINWTRPALFPNHLEIQVHMTEGHYQVLARKWRPQAFDDVVGQEHVTRTLRNAIQSGRVGHAFLFIGSRGIGKTACT